MTAITCQVSYSDLSNRKGQLLLFENSFDTHWTLWFPHLRGVAHGVICQSMNSLIFFSSKR